jgi:hypothetical protein
MHSTQVCTRTRDATTAGTTVRRHGARYRISRRQATSPIIDTAEPMTTMEGAVFVLSRLIQRRAARVIGTTMEAMAVTTRFAHLCMINAKAASTAHLHRNRSTDTLGATVTINSGTALVNKTTTVPPHRILASTMSHEHTQPRRTTGRVTLTARTTVDLLDTTLHRAIAMTTTVETSGTIG